MSEETPDPDDLRERLEALAERLDDADTEAAYEEIEADIDELEAAVDDLEDDEEIEALEDEVTELADTLEEERGPYTADVVAELESAVSTLESEEWTDDGVDAVTAAVATFAELDVVDEVEVADVDAAVDALRDAIDAIEGADYDPDADAEAIQSALEAAEQLTAALEAAETWDDLSVRERLEAHGFYDVLDHRKDYPPEWSAVKAYEAEGNAEMILLALDLLDSDFMEENCIESLKRLGSPAALEPMIERANRRDRDAIEVLGRIGDDEPVDMLIEFIEEGTNRPLELTILLSLGRIGSEEATQTIANRLVAEDPLVRSTAARALGMIGDTRAIEPLADRLAEDEAGNVRGSAAWALNQIGTEAALEAASEYADDREYLVEAQATRAAQTLEAS